MKVGVTTTLPPGRLPIQRHAWKPKPSTETLTPKPELSPADVPTPPAGTPAPRLTSRADMTPAPRLTTPADLPPALRVTLPADLTPAPRVRPTPRPMLPLAARQPTLPPVEPAVQGLHVAKGTLAGLCLMMFSFGVITTVLVDRYWPTRKAEWAGSVAAQVQAPAAVTQALPPAPIAAAAATKTESPSPAPSPSVEPMPVDVPPPSEAKAVPAETTAPAAAKVEPNRAPATRPAPAQGRSPANKRPGTGRPAGSTAQGGDRTMAPTGTWVDPFE